MNNKLKAVVAGRDTNCYRFQDLDSGEFFSVPISVIHEIVDFPNQLVDADGMLRTGSVIDMVMKTSQEDTCRFYYPSTKIYQKKINPVAAAIQTALATSILLFLEHLDEVDKQTRMKIVKALSTHDDHAVITLINSIIFK